MEDSAELQGEVCVRSYIQDNFPWTKGTLRVHYDEANKVWLCRLIYKQFYVMGWHLNNRIHEVKLRDASLRLEMTDQTTIRVRKFNGNASAMKKLLKQIKGKKTVVDQCVAPDYPKICHATAEKCSDSIQQLQKCRKEGSLVDYTLVSAEGMEFPVHKTHVACSSDYLMTMLTGPLKESKEDRVKLPAVSSNGLALILDYVYGEDLPLNQGNIEDIVTAASYLQVCSVLKECYQYMTETMEFGNCLKYNDLHDTYAMSSYKVSDNCNLSVMLENFIKDKWQAFVTAGERDRLPVQSFKQYLESNSMDTESEIFIFDVVCDWIQARPERKKYAKEVMSYVRFPLMTEEELTSLVKRPVVVGNQGIGPMIKEALEYVTADIATKLTKQSKQTQVRGSQHLVTFSGIVGSCAVSNQFHVLDLEELGGKWVQFPDVPYEFFKASVAVLRGFIFVCGGCAPGQLDQKTTNACYVFDPRTWSWSTVASMNKPRASFPLPCDGDFLYAVGGLHQKYVVEDQKLHECDASIERYCPDKNQWNVIALLKTPVRLHAAACVNNTLYVYGGLDSMNQPVQQFHAYNLSTRTWSKLSVYPQFIPERAVLLPGERETLHIFFIDNLVDCCNYVFRTDSLTWLRYNYDYPIHVSDSYRTITMVGKNLYRFVEEESGYEVQKPIFGINPWRFLDCEHLSGVRRHLSCSVPIPYTLIQEAKSALEEAPKESASDSD